MAVNGSPTIRRRRLGAELRRLRHAAGMTHQQVAGRSLAPQSKISLIETGRRAINPRDVRDVCELYEVTDELIVGSLMRMAKESGRQGWWVAYGDVPYGIYIGMETEAASIHSYEPLVPPGLLQTRAYAAAVTAESNPDITPEQVAARPELRLQRQHRAHHPARPFRLWTILDESALRRSVGTPDVMREQLQHLNHLSTRPHITVQVLPDSAGAHPGVSGQFSILAFSDTDAGVVYLERFTSGDLYLERPADRHPYHLMCDHLQAQALGPEQSHRFIGDVLHSRPGPGRLRRVP
ncbi:helix-turn-helix domain-containing protein [Streptomyces sp. NPDC059650]|uniref:helix-turn-helix domain-containing protein n=1 Tax=Streptomyces sp. NPDC059650 TaxID=3346896 RepID=UPI003691D9BD